MFVKYFDISFYIFVFLVLLVLFLDNFTICYMKVVEMKYNDDYRLKIKGSGKTFFGKTDVEICNLNFVTIYECKKINNVNEKNKENIKGYVKIFDKKYDYNVNELKNIFVTKDEYKSSLSSIKYHFKVVQEYYVSPKLYLASLDYLQIDKSFITKFPPPFIFKKILDRFETLSVHYINKVRYSKTNSEKNSSGVYRWFKTNNFCISLLGHCMIEGFGPKNGIIDPIKILIDDNDGGKKKIPLSIGLGLENYVYPKSDSNKMSKLNNNYLLFEIMNKY